MVALNHSIDPTLAALDDLHSQAFSGDQPRRYLGASAVGHECSRRLWYGFRWALSRAITASGYRAIQDGHRGEAVMIDWLRSIPGIQLWTEDPEQPGKQISFEALAGHFRGNIDGVIQGLLQAPKTPHVWEMKVCNEAKWNKLNKLICEKGEKAALAEWDAVYFAQAQIYMDQLNLTRHYLTVGTPGNRAVTSCRTDYQPKFAKAILKKAETIITADRPPLKISENATWYICKFCDYHSLCHGKTLPDVNCRTCAHSTARIDEKAAPWTCELNQPEILNSQRGCASHAWHPDLLANHAEAINANPKTGVITFRMKADPAVTFENGAGAVSSRVMKDKERAVKKPVVEIPVDDDVRASLALEMVIDEPTLLSGDLTEQDFDRLAKAASRLSNAWEGDEPRKHALRALIEQVDSAFMALAGKVTMRRTA